MFFLYCVVYVCFIPMVKKIGHGRLPSPINQSVDFGKLISKSIYNALINKVKKCAKHVLWLRILISEIFN